MEERRQCSGYVYSPLPLFPQGVTRFPIPPPPYLPHTPPACTCLLSLLPFSSTTSCTQPHSPYSYKPLLFSLPTSHTLPPSPRSLSLHTPSPAVTCRPCFSPSPPPHPEPILRPFPSLASPAQSFSGDLGKSGCSLRHPLPFSPPHPLPAPLHLHG